MDPFVAIDFETLSLHPDTAWCVAVARVDNGNVREPCEAIFMPHRWLKHHALPARSRRTLEEAGAFCTAWMHLAPLFAGAKFVAAHNAAFDQRVLWTLCAHTGIAPPRLPWLCTVELARRTWMLADARLPTICAHLSIALKHHDAASDAAACAKIVLASGAVDEEGLVAIPPHRER
jgi:DNA polymerase-3 subunit epsilon